jgi:coenzyme F420-0:L-glutamate ligase / coenzyme F420-1:gamma-L-glutamate ligase
MGESKPRLTVFAVDSVPLVTPGMDLVAALGDAIEASGIAPAEDDVLVVAQKVVSKAEDRFVATATVAPSEEAGRVAERSGKEPAVIELVLGESAEVMRAVPGVVITRHRSGHVLANAGIDASNVGREGTVLLWPVDPDASAARLRDGLCARFGVRMAVVVSDSLGRAWRMGTMGTAIGCAGLKPLRDRRGETDLFGRVLEATLIGVADEIAAAASLVIGEAAEGIAAAIVRGAPYEPAEDIGIAPLLRPIAQDLFR